MMRRPDIRQLVAAVKLLGEVVDASGATYCFDGRISVPLAAGWSLVISSDDADRFRIEACLSGRARATMWCLAGDDARLVELASAARNEAAALAV